MLIDVQREGDVFVLTMTGGENRFSGDFMDAFERALDAVERATAPAALVTIGQGKFYSNGLDLDWMMSQGPAGARGGLARALALLGRVLTFPTFTVAAINGHAFGAGAQLAVAHDLRLMRTERGYFCMPEIDMQVAKQFGITERMVRRCRTDPKLQRFMPHPVWLERDWVKSARLDFEARQVAKRLMTPERLAKQEPLTLVNGAVRVGPVVGEIIQRPGPRHRARRPRSRSRPASPPPRPRGAWRCPSSASS